VVVIATSFDGEFDGRMREKRWVFSEKARLASFTRASMFRI